MAVRISGVNISPRKRLDIGLTSIYGIGRKLAKKILEGLNFNPGKRVQDLSDEEVRRIREVIDRDYIVEGGLRSQVSSNIKLKMNLGCYEGLRHRRRLPVRGQNTHNNARTRKGKAKPIANKKK